MDKKALIRLACRALALNSLLWAIESLTYVPMTSLSLSHYAQLAVKTASEGYFFRYYLTLLITRLVTSVTLFVAAIWLYRCGPTVERFLAPSEE